MRKLKAAGIVAAGTLGLSVFASGPVGAASTTYIITGTLNPVYQNCTNITLAFSGQDCTYARTRPTVNGWIGPLFGGANYPKDSPQASISYVPRLGINNPLGNPLATSFTPAAPDGKLNAPLSGELLINDNGTPSDPADDIVSGTFTIGALARNVPTAQTRRAVEQWTTMDNVLVATPVNPTLTVANEAGGVDYVVGSRGFPTPLCFRYNSADCFASTNSVDNLSAARFWEEPPAGGIGIERTGFFGDPNGFTNTRPPPAVPTGNVGATTTATFTGYTCADNGVANDCTQNVLLWGAGEDPGFDNLIMKISTNSVGQITSALVYYSQETYIAAFADPAEIGYDNSVVEGAFSFTGFAEGSGPSARDFAASIVQDSVGNSLNTTANCVNFTGPITVSIVTPPTKGTATVVGAVGAQTISYDSTGALGDDTIVYSCTSGAETNNGTIAISIVPDTVPSSPNGSISISTQGAAPGPGTVGTVNVATLDDYESGNLPSVVSISTPPANGTATVLGTTITFIPSANPPFFAGTATISYVITDNDSDVSAPAGVITVTIPDLTPSIPDGAITTEQDTASAAKALSITPGNGTIAQGTVLVTTQAVSGDCTITGSLSVPTLTYIPDPGYSGPDSCVVTVTDGNGSFDAGTFDIVVADGGIKLPGGGSSMDLWSLSLLGALPLLRRRRRT